MPEIGHCSLVILFSRLPEVIIRFSFMRTYGELIMNTKSLG